MEQTQAVTPNISNDYIYREFQSRQKKLSGTPMSRNNEYDEVTFSNKEKNKTYLKYGIGGGAVVLGIIALVKRNKIKQFFSKFFKKAPDVNIDINKTKNGSKTVDEIKFPEPNFKIDKSNPEQYAKEKKEYVDSIIHYADHTDKNLNIKALNAIEKYGTSEHLEKFGGLYLGKEDEELIRPFVRTAAAIGKPVEHSFYIFEWLIDPNYKLSTETYKEIFKGIEKIGVKPGLYKYLPNVFNKVSTSPDDELAKALTNTLCKVSTKEHIPELQKYAGNENPVVRESIAKIIKTVGHKS